MLKFLSNLFSSKTSDDNTKLTTSEKPVESENKTEEVTVQKSAEEQIFEVLNETINSIELDLKNVNTDSFDLLTMCISVSRHKQFYELIQLYRLADLLGKDFYSRRFKRNIVCGELNGKDHTWIVVGVNKVSHVSCNFIYKQYEKEEDIKWIIDLQPILDDVNNHIAILDYNEHPEYIPYGNKTIPNVYQKPEYYTTINQELIKIHNGYYFEADILLFLLDSDFVDYPHRYVNNTNKELFEKIQKNTNQLMEILDSEDCFDIKRHIVSLFKKNEKLDLIPKHYQVMF